jgi:hypothetical protein
MTTRRRPREKSISEVLTMDCEYRRAGPELPEMRSAH